MLLWGHRHQLFRFTITILMHVKLWQQTIVETIQNYSFFFGNLKNFIALPDSYVKSVYVN